VYAALKEAISALSPIIRNRLRGLPAYVLDYADLIPPNRCVTQSTFSWTAVDEQGQVMKGTQMTSPAPAMIA